VFFIVKDKSEWISEYSDSLNETDGMFPLIPDRFLSIPLELNAHYWTMPHQNTGYRKSSYQSAPNQPRSSMEFD
jgi:hypothetical protein